MHVTSSAGPAVCSAAALAIILAATSPATANDLPAEVRQEVERADGLVAPSFAFCLTLPADRLAAVNVQLAREGLHAVRVRPFPAPDGVRVAALWHRDDRTARVRLGATGAAVLAETASTTTCSRHRLPTG